MPTVAMTAALSHWRDRAAEIEAVSLRVLGKSARLAADHARRHGGALRNVVLALAVVTIAFALSATPARTAHAWTSEDVAAALMDEGFDCISGDGVTICDVGADCELDRSCGWFADHSVVYVTLDDNFFTGMDDEHSYPNVDLQYHELKSNPDRDLARRGFLTVIGVSCPAAAEGAVEWLGGSEQEQTTYPGADCSVTLSRSDFGDTENWHGYVFYSSPQPTLDPNAVDPCSLLTEADVEGVLGIEAQPGQMETLPFPATTQYCSYGTAPFELQVFANSSREPFEERAENLRALEGQIVEEVDEDGLRALWVYSTTFEIHSNRLSVPMDDGWFVIDFQPLTPAAQASRVSLQPEQREQAIELARIALGLGPVASIAPSASAEPAIQSPSASAGEDSGAVGGLGGGPAAAPAAPGEFVASIPTPAAVSADLPVVLQSALLALAVIFLMPFPAQLFNSTVEEHRDEIRGWFAPITRAFRAVGEGLDSFWRTPVGIGLFLVVSAILYALLDPAFGLSPEAVITLAGIAIGIIVVTVLFALPAVLSHRRHGDRPVVEAIPGTLLVGIACVAVSRLADFQPGYLYGLVIGLNFARELDTRDEGRNGAAAAVLMLLAAVVAWFGLGLLVDGGATGFVAAVGETVLAAVMVAGLEGVVFGLLPLRFLPGEPVYAWNRVVWGALLGIGLFAFFHILINPSSGYLSDSSRTPLLTVIGLLVGFGVLSVAFWAYFRYRPKRAEHGVES